jgi:nucleoside-diphosphate-sugar epimerase/uncharacterized membrane protein
MPEPSDRPWILLTGATGAIGSALAEALAADYRLFGLDRDCSGLDYPHAEVDLGDDASVQAAFAQLRTKVGGRIASVIHLAAYFDFSGEPNPLYQSVNVDGTRRVLEALQGLEVEQFVYTSTMLVHAAGRPGERIDEDAPIIPGWVYPQSKAAAEEIIALHHGRIPYVLLRFAGLYDDDSAVPTLAQQIVRIYQRDLTSRVATGDLDAGQSMIHREDLIDSVLRTIERRAELPAACALLVGEPEPISYRELQDTLGALIHGEDEWATLSLPAPVAKAGAWLQGAAEPLIPDVIDHGEKPFIRPFMVDRASDHYALDIGRARRLLGWQPRHRLRRQLPQLVAALKRDPRGWYRRHRITPPAWLADAEDDDAVQEPEALRRAHEQAFRAEHRRLLWARALIVLLGGWLLGAPLMFEYDSAALRTSDLLAGAATVVLGAAALSWRFAWARFLLALVGLWLLFAPLLFRAADAAVYLNDSLVGMLLIGLALAVPPWPGVSPLAARHGPEIPPEAERSPSGWLQRAPIVLLALLGLLLSRSMAAYQLGHIDALWDPWFTSSLPGRNGSEAIVTSWLSEAFPLPDAGLGALVYALEVVLGLAGPTTRWRTMPWLVLAFGALVVPLGVVSILFIIVQPLLFDTWCALCLIAAAAMLLQIPFALGEQRATLAFLRRRQRAGHPWLRVLFRGDTDGGGVRREADPLARPLHRQLRDAVGGIGLPWTLAAAIALGIWLLFTRLTLGHDGALANADHVLGALVITVATIACAEVARPLQRLLLPLGAALMLAPWWLAPATGSVLADGLAGAALIALALRYRPLPGQRRG